MAQAWPTRRRGRFWLRWPGGEAPDELADELAAAVLDDDLVRLALAVAAGGDHRWRRAIELAGAVLAVERAEAGAGAGRGSGGRSGGS